MPCARASGEAGRAERARLHARRKVSGRLAVGVPGKAPVEDGDRDAGPVEPRRTRAVGAEERDALAGDGGRRERQRPLDAQDVRAGGERLEPLRRHEGLQERAVDVLDLAAVGLDRRLDGGGRSGLEEDAHRPVLGLERRLAGELERAGRLPRCGCDRRERGIELARRRAPGGQDRLLVGTVEPRCPGGRAGHHAEHCRIPCTARTPRRATATVPIPSTNPPVVRRHSGA